MTAPIQQDPPSVIVGGSTVDRAGRQGFEGGVKGEAESLTLSKSCSEPALPPGETSDTVGSRSLGPTPLAMPLRSQSHSAAPNTRAPCRCSRTAGPSGLPHPTMKAPRRRSELESLSNTELGVLHTRFDLMDDEELATYLRSYEGDWQDAGRGQDRENGGKEGGDDIATSGPGQGPGIPISSSRPHGHSTPLFPPSPPLDPSSGADELGNRDSGRKPGDHPLRILARAVLELQETVDRLKDENAVLKEEIKRSRTSTSTATSAPGALVGVGGHAVIPTSAGADAISIHDDLSEAISTSLTDPSSLPITATDPRYRATVPGPTGPSQYPLRPHSPSPAPTVRSHAHRAGSPNPLRPGKIHSHATHTRPHPSGRLAVRTTESDLDPLHQSSSRSVRSMEVRSDSSIRSVDMHPPPPPSASASASASASSIRAIATPPISTKKRDARSSWTASLWGWAGTGSPSSAGAGAGGGRKGIIGRDRKGSEASSLRSAPVKNGSTHGNGTGTDTENGQVLMDEEDEHAWRRGDGGSPPPFRAVFLATRLLTPDPMSILTSASDNIKSDGLIARLAHALVSAAREDGITARDPPVPGRRRSSRETRSRAASLYSHDRDQRDSDDEHGGDGAGGESQAREGGKQAEWGYGDTLIAAGSYGRSLLSSVSGATLRPSKSRGSGCGVVVAKVETGGTATIRPTLLSKGSGRTYPTTALSQTTAADISPDPGAISDPHRSGDDDDASAAMAAPVEMAAIVADEHQPPTVLLSRQNLALFFQSTKAGKMHTASRFNNGSEPPLTDRYGFIYDIQHASMLKDASAAGAPAPASLSGLIPGHGHGHAQLVEQEGQGWIDRHRRASQETRPEESRRSSGSIEQLLSGTVSPSKAAAGHVTTTGSASTGSLSGMATPAPGNVESAAADTSAISRKAIASDQHRHRSSTLLSLNPSPARPVTAKETLTVSARGASSLRSAASSPLFTPATEIPSAFYPEIFPPSSDAMSGHVAGAGVGVSRATISSLLDQLTELHDRQQAERKVEWDAWLKKRSRRHAAKVKAAAAAAAADGKGKGLAHGTGINTGWSTDLIGISQMGLSKNAEEWRGFSRLVRKGIPLEYRADVWAECSGAKDALVPGEYKEILDVHSGDESPMLRDINKDVSRTFPGNMFFGGDGPGVAKLRRVLVAYSWRNPNVGYCQGMNMLAATLLLTHTDEEQAFWVLAAMLDRLLPADFYSPSLLASRADQAVLSELVDVHLTKVSAHLADLGVDLASITFGWFLSLFTDCLPVETLFRVWDVFFVEGHDSLFCVALAILKLNEAEICAAETAGDLFVLVAGMTSRLWAADKLIMTQHGFKSSVKHSDIAARFAKHIAALQDA